MPILQPPALMLQILQVHRHQQWIQMQPKVYMTKKTKLNFCSPTFPDFFFYFFRIVIQHKISPYLSGFSIFKSIVSFLLKFYMYVPYNVLYWNVCFDIHIVISLTTVNTFCLFSQFKLVYKCYSNNLEFNVISFEQLQTVRQLQFKTEVYS